MWSNYYQVIKNNYLALVIKSTIYPIDCKEIVIILSVTMSKHMWNVHEYKNDNQRTSSKHLHLRLPPWKVENGQSLQEYGLLSACRFMWFLNSGSSAKASPHLSHTHGLIPKWTLLKCFSNPLVTIYTHHNIVTPLNVFHHTTNFTCTYT